MRAGGGLSKHLVQAPLNDLGVSFVRQGNLTQAVALFERLIAIDPDNADAHSNLGAIFLTQGAEARAERELILMKGSAPGMRPGRRTFLE